MSHWSKKELKSLLVGFHEGEVHPDYTLIFMTELMISMTGKLMGRQNCWLPSGGYGWESDHKADGNEPDIAYPYLRNHPVQSRFKVSQWNGTGYTFSLKWCKLPGVCCWPWQASISQQTLAEAKGWNSVAGVSRQWIWYNPNVCMGYSVSYNSSSDCQVCQVMALYFDKVTIPLDPKYWGRRIGYQKE